MQADNTIRVLNLASTTAECSIHGVRPSPSGTAPLESTGACCLQPGSGLLVLPGDNALLQFYDAARDRHVGKMQVAPRNMVSISHAPQVIHRCNSRR